MFKSGFISIVGRPNVGKSTLMNLMMGQKLAIVSSKPQTTRKNMQTILTTKDYQMVFVDTPGIHKPKHKLGEYMVSSAKDSFKDVDLILFITTTEDGLERGDDKIVESLKNSGCPVFLVLNKTDESTPQKVAETLRKYSEVMDFAEIIPISALKSRNTDTLIDLMVKYMPEGPKYYPEEMITDVQERFIISEIVREKALRNLNQEVPHGIAVEVIQMKQNDKGMYNIEVELICEKASHKGIIIGKNGQTLKRIGQRARMDIEKMLDAKVNLKIWVKVRKEWRDSTLFLNELGYKKQK